MEGLEPKGYAGRLIRAVPAPETKGAENAASAPAAPVIDPHQAEAERMLSRAQSQAETIISRAEGAAQRIRDEAAGRAHEERDLKLTEALLGFSRQIHQELDDIRPVLVRMVIEAVEAIIGTVPKEELAEQMIRRALRDLDQAKAAKLYTSRQDFTAMSTLIAQMAETGERTIQSVEPDSDLAPGICRLEAGGLSIEVGLKSQLDVLESMLLRESAVEPGAVSLAEDESGTEPTSRAAENPAPGLL